MKPNPAAIAFQNVTFQRGNQTVLKRVSFEVQPGETLAIIGPSGSGKSTLLRLLAGLETPTEGSIILNGTDATRTKPEHRGIGFVFQGYALFAHLSVFDNIAYGLRMKRLPKADISDRVNTWLDRVGLRGYERRLPADLSGGERQRVAIARALAAEPRVLALDEPLSALDPSRRADLRDQLRSIVKESGLPTLWVSHDREEAFAVADRFLALIDGEVAQVDHPEELYRHPATEAVARLLGPDSGLNSRPEDICLGPPGSGRIEARVRESRFFGDHYRLVLETDQGIVIAQVKKPPLAEFVSIC